MCTVQNNNQRLYEDMILIDDDERTFLLHVILKGIDNNDFKTFTRNLMNS